MVKFSVSSKHETLLSLQGCKSQKESLDQDKIKLERNFENCATNLVKMNYRLASVFFVRAFWKYSNLHNFHRAFEQA